MGTVMDESRLAAYVDGALEPEEAAAVVIHLADNAGDRQYVERVAELNALLSRAYAAPLTEPVPDRIRRTVDPSTVTPFRRRGGLLPAAIAGVALAAAASVALVLGVPAGLRTTDPATPAPGPIAGGSDLHAALETRPSGDMVRLPDGDELTLIATFRDGRDRACREFEILHDGATEFSRGIACRNADAAWTVAVIVSEPLGGEPDDDAGYVPAMGATDAALRGALDVLGAGPTLTPSAEQELVRSGWSSR